MKQTTLLNVHVLSSACIRFTYLFILKISISIQRYFQNIISILYQNWNPDIESSLVVFFLCRTRATCLSVSWWLWFDTFSFQVKPPKSPGRQIEESNHQQLESDHCKASGRGTGLWRNRGSPVWQYFIPQPMSAVCKLCHRSQRRSGGNTSNLLAHLKHVHREQHAAMIDEQRRMKMQILTQHSVVRLTTLLCDSVVVAMESWLYQY